MSKSEHRAGVRELTALNPTASDAAAYYSK